MADKYVSHGNTYNGDGTTKDAASSDGGVGAWNDLIAVMTAAPTYGTLEAGDIVNVRTQISGTDITIDISADTTVLKRGGKDTGTVDWVFDDGTIWSGDSGVLTINETADVSFIIDEYNYFIGKSKNFRVKGNYNGHHYDSVVLNNRVVLRDIQIESESSTNSLVTEMILISGFSRATLIDCLIWERRVYTNASNYPIIYLGAYGSTVYFINCEFKTDMSSFSAYGLIESKNLGGVIYVIGGKTTGFNSDRHFIRDVASSWSGMARVHIKSFDAECKLINMAAKELNYRADIYGVDFATPFDAKFLTHNGETQWEAGQSYPTLNALLPDGTAWSYRILPQDDTNVFVTSPYIVVELLKYFSDTAAIKKITVELLINSAIANPKKAEYFIEVGYCKDVGGYKVDVSEIDFTTVLASSTASWSTTTYGGNTYVKYKIEVTTSFAIKQYSDIAVRLKTGRARVNADDYVFVDPDFAVEAP